MIFLLSLTASAQVLIFEDSFENRPPVIESAAILDATIDQLYTYDVEASDAPGEVLTYSLTLAPEGMIIDPSTGLIEWTPTTLGGVDVTVRVTDDQGAFAEQSWILTVNEPGPEPLSPPPIDDTVMTAFPGAIEFLYSGDNPPQQDVQPDALEDHRVSVVRGIVATRDGSPLSNVRVSVLKDEGVGYVLSRDDGGYDIAVNGGGRVTVQFERDGYLTAQRSVQVPWNDFRTLDTVRLVTLSPTMTTVVLSETDAVMAQGDIESDEDGARQGTLIFQPGTTAEMEMPDGTLQPLTSLDVRITEFTVGPNGPEAMPAELPPTSEYTYAAEYTVDEALAAGAVAVHFDPAVVFYLDDFLDFPVGTLVPLGAYSRVDGQWEAAPDGVVLQIVGITSGLVDVDLDGDGLADDSATIGMTDSERERLAGLYSPGKKLWRVYVAHFSPWDCNWAAIPPPGSRPPRPEDGPRRKGPPAGEDCPDYGFSQVDCQAQSLREAIPVAGTDQALHYRSDRAEGHVAGRSLEVFISAEDIPEIADQVRIELDVAGQVIIETHPASADVSTTVVWDGLDAYGRQMYGSWPYSMSISYIYSASYGASSSGGSGGAPGSGDGGGPSSFFSQGGVSLGTLSRGQILLSRRYEGYLDATYPEHSSLGDWSLSDHHILGVSSLSLFLGTGDARRDADGVQEKAVRLLRYDRNLNDESSSIPMPDGSVLVGKKEGGENAQVWRVYPDGSTSLVAGWDYQFANFGDGGAARWARLDFAPNNLTVLADGSLLIGQVSRIRRVESVDPSATIDTVGGVGSLPIEDNMSYVGPFIDLKLDGIIDIAAGPDGSYYVAARAPDASVSDTIWQVTPDGTAQRVAGTATGPGVVNGVSAIESEMDIGGIAIAANGDIYLTDESNHEVRRISGGVIERVMGTGECTGDWLAEGPALSTELCRPEVVAISSSGAVYVASASSCSGACPLGSYTQRVYAYDGERLDLIAGGFGLLVFNDGGFALGNRLGNLVNELDIMPNDTLLYQSRTGTNNIYIIESPYEEIDAVYSDNGRYRYSFDISGRHLATEDTFLQRTVRTFEYDEGGRLISTTDAYGRSVTIERDAEGVATAVVGPDGRSTALEFTDGRLTLVTNPASETVAMDYGPIGALTSFEDARGNASSYVYDDEGYLISATNRDGGTITLDRTTLGIEDYEVAVTRRGSEVTTYRLEVEGNQLTRTTTDPTGATTVVTVEDGGVVRGDFPDGTTAVYRREGDPRVGAKATRVSSYEFITPDGVTTTATVDSSVILDDPRDPSTMIQWSETTTVDGRASTVSYDVASRTLTWTTPEGRTGSEVYDEFGETITETPAGGLAPVSYGYDAAGRLTSITKLNETAALSYDANGDLVSATDDDGEITSWSYDAAGRLVTATLPSGAQYDFTLDANGNRTAVTQPEGQTHTMVFDPNDRLASYALPGAPALNLDLDPLGRREGVTYPDGSSRDDLFTDGQLTGSTLPASTLALTRLPEADGPGTSKQIDSLTRDPADRPAQVIDLTLDGGLVTALDYSGPSLASVSYTHDFPYRVATRSLDLEPAFGFSYDDDGLFTAKGPFSLDRNAASGILEAIGDGTLEITVGVDGRGNLADRALSHSGSPIHDLALIRDDRTRITTMTDTLMGLATVRNYTYDVDGQLVEVTDGLDAPVASFEYDGNGNRTSHTDGDGTEVATYDSQDRIVTRGAISYGYDDNGALATRGADSFEYAADGVLRSVTVGGDTVTYDNDYVGRRAARTDSSGTTMFIYGDLQHPFRLTASIAPDSEVSEYLYDDAGFLFALRRGGAWYYVATDPVGSPRAVIEAATGSVVKAVEYSAFGEVLSDSAPGFDLPVGFAGGLTDPVSDLVRFGLRDYEPAAGRFTARDPVLLAGGSVNLYIYVDNDPINYRDLSGLFLKLEASAYAGFGGGVSMTISGSGIGFCAEGGVGVGGGLGAEPAELSDAGFSAVLAAGVGPLGTGIEVPFDDCWASGRPRFNWDGAGASSDRVTDAVDDKVGGIFSQAGNQTSETFLGKNGSKAAKSISNAFPGGKGRLKGKLGAEAKLSVRGCLPPLTW